MRAASGRPRMASPKARLILDGLLMSWVASIRNVCPYSPTLETSLHRRKSRVEAQASTGARPLLRHRLLLQPGGSRGVEAIPSGLKSVLVLAAVGYLNHGRGRDHRHRVQRSRGEQPFTKRLGVLYRGEFDAYEHLGGIVNTAKDLIRRSDFGASRRICVESRLPRVVIVGLMVQQHVGHREPPWIGPASDTDPNPPMAACEIRDRSPSTSLTAAARRLRRTQRSQTAGLLAAPVGPRTAPISQNSGRKKPMMNITQCPLRRQRIPSVSRRTK